jgi:Family of unknown function (DUF5947)
MPGTLVGSRLRQLAREPVAAGPGTEPEERCELCGAPIGAAHRHLLELSSRALLCTCRPCALLFDRDGAAGGRYRLVPERRLRLDGFAMADDAWERLRIPVDMAFFFHSSTAGRVVALYPGPMGPVESRLELDSWRELQESNPILGRMEEDVEALLVDRARGARRQWLVPVDECFSLVGLIRTRWRGLTGGRDVWVQIDRFFDELDRRARGVRGGG